MAEEVKIVREYPTWMDEGMPEPLMKAYFAWLENVRVSPPIPDGTLCAMAADFVMSPEELGPSLTRHGRNLMQALMVPMRDAGYLVLEVKMDTYAFKKPTDLGTYGYTATVLLRRLNADLLCTTVNEDVRRLDVPAVTTA